MQVAGVTSSLPLSTQIIKKAGQAAQAPEAPVNPEQVNRAVDRASDRVTENQASRRVCRTLCNRVWDYCCGSLPS